MPGLDRLECRAHLARVLVATRRLLLQAPLDHRLAYRRRTPSGQRRWAHLSGSMRTAPGLVGAAERLARRSPSRTAAPRGPRCRCAHPWRSPRICSGAIAYGVPAAAPAGTSDAIVVAFGEQRVAHAGPDRNRRSSIGRAVRDHRVGGLEVAVNDAVVVRVRERVGRLDPVPHSLLQRQRAPPSSRSLSGRPSTYSIAMNAEPFASPTS